MLNTANILHTRHMTINQMDAKNGCTECLLVIVDCYIIDCRVSNGVLCMCSCLLLCVMYCLIPGHLSPCVLCVLCEWCALCEYCVYCVNGVLVLLDG